jgi:hypothetical protein
VLTRVASRLPGRENFALRSVSSSQSNGGRQWFERQQTVSEPETDTRFYH